MLNEAYKLLLDIILPSSKTDSDSAANLIGDLYGYDAMVAGALETLISKGNPMAGVLVYDDEIENSMTRLLYSGTLNVGDSFIIISALNYLNVIKYVLFLARDEIRLKREH